MTRKDHAAIAIILSMGALAICTLVGYGSVLMQTLADTSGIVMDAERFQGVRALLPPRGMVGYFSDTVDRKAYYLTQYYLAPVVVAPDAAHEIVIANCSSWPALTALAAANGLTIVRRFPNGVAILRRPPR